MSPGVEYELFLHKCWNYPSMGFYVNMKEKRSTQKSCMTWRIDDILVLLLKVLSCKKRKWNYLSKEIRRLFDKYQWSHKKCFSFHSFFSSLLLFHSRPHDGDLRVQTLFHSCAFFFSNLPLESNTIPEKVCNAMQVVPAFAFWRKFFHSLFDTNLFTEAQQCLQRHEFTLPWFHASS